MIPWSYFEFGRVDRTETGAIGQGIKNGAYVEGIREIRCCANDSCAHRGKERREGG